MQEGLKGSRYDFEVGEIGKRGLHNVGRVLRLGRGSREIKKEVGRILRLERLAREIYKK